MCDFWCIDGNVLSNFQFVMKHVSYYQTCRLFVQQLAMGVSMASASFSVCGKELYSNWILATGELPMQEYCGWCLIAWDLVSLRMGPIYCQQENYELVFLEMFCMKFDNFLAGGSLHFLFFNERIVISAFSHYSFGMWEYWLCTISTISFMRIWFS